MQYEGHIIRPPSEAHSIIIQVTAGCSHNKCIFCGAYKDKPFRLRNESFEDDIAYAMANCRHQNRVFLADGDALIIPYHRLHHILQVIKERLPWVNRVSLYANAKAIRSKTEEQLLVLKDLGLNRIYLGLESGHDKVLEFIQKGESSQSMIEAAKKVTGCGLYLSVTVLLGIGGVELSQEHAEATGKVLNQMGPQQIAALSLIPLDGTPLNQLIKARKFELPNKYQLISELKVLVEQIDLKRVQFYANHASNYLPISGRLQKDKEKLISQLDDALAGKIELIPEHYRGL